MQGWSWNNQGLIPTEPGLGVKTKTIVCIVKMGGYYPVLIYFKAVPSRDRSHIRDSFSPALSVLFFFQILSSFSTLFSML